MKGKSLSSIVFLVIISLVLAACSGPAPTKIEIQTQALPAAQQEYIRSLAQAGIFLGPEDPLPVQAPTREERCKDRIKNLPKDYIYGWMEVPENPLTLKGPKINIFYYGRVDRQTQNPQDVTIFYNGGPGSDSEGSFKLLNRLQNEDAQKNKINFLFIDQRGNGCSDPYPQGISEETLQRLAFYGTRGIVSDSEYIRKALLGSQKWRVFGQSYGAYIVHKYAIVEPKSVSKAYAHANAITASPIQRHAERISSQARVLNEYFKSYPEDQKRLETLNDFLIQKPCVTADDDQKYCGFTLSSPFVSMLGFKTSWNKLNSWLMKIVPNKEINQTELKNLATLYLVNDGDPANRKGVASLVISYVDRNYFDFDGKLCAKAFQYLQSRGEKPKEFMINECKDETTTYADGTTGEQDDFDYSILKSLKTDWMTPEQLKNSLVKNPNLDFFLYSGQLDAFVPVANFQEELAVVKPYVHYTHFMNTGHDGFYTEPQVWSDLLK